MPSSVTNKKYVSFGDSSSNVVHIVENYKLTLGSHEDRQKVWYGRIELAKFARDEFYYQFDGTDEEATVAYETFCAEKHKWWHLRRCHYCC